MSVANDGTQADQRSDLPAISGDGRFVSFETSAALVAGDTNGFPDVYVRDLQENTTTRVSVTSDGSQLQLNGSPTFASNSSLSGDGRFVAFTSDADNLAPNDTKQRRRRVRQGSSDQHDHAGKPG